MTWRLPNFILRIALRGVSGIGQGLSEIVVKATDIMIIPQQQYINYLLLWTSRVCVVLSVEHIQCAILSISTPSKADIVCTCPCHTLRTFSLRSSPLRRHSSRHTLIPPPSLSRDLRIKLHPVSLGSFSLPLSSYHTTHSQGKEYTRLTCHFCKPLCGPSFAEPLDFDAILGSWSFTYSCARVGHCYVCEKSKKRERKQAVCTFL
jgi:hypothetical protein